MECKNRLAVFEHVNTKERTKRPRSPEPIFNTSHVNLKKPKRVTVPNDAPIFNCIYNGCSASDFKYYDLLNHLEDHVNRDQDKDSFACKWSSCGETFTKLGIFRQHVLYHGYQLKLQQVALNFLQETSVPDCTEPVVKFPTLPSYYICDWDNCNDNIATYQRFLDHVRCHVNTTEKKADNKNLIKCEWIGCSSAFTAQFKLVDHVKTHTKEKCVSCPDCGGFYANKTKFYDHRKRQLKRELQGYQCSQCSRLFASERLLRDHMRTHINHYKCHLCDMTCPKPSALARHIRYRHLSERLFKCTICSHTTITQNDLNRHIRTHSLKGVEKCPHCDFKCRSKVTMIKHLKIHEGTWGNRYACHCCEKRFAKGGILTKHLIKVHDFHWPSGHSRFSYKQDSKTGLFHLQVVRYESIEVTQEMMQDNIQYQPEIDQNYKFECKQEMDKPYAFEVKVFKANTDEDVDDPEPEPEREPEPEPEQQNIIYSSPLIDNDDEAMYLSPVINNDDDYDDPLYLSPLNNDDNEAMYSSPVINDYETNLLSPLVMINENAVFSTSIIDDDDDAVMFSSPVIIDNDTEEYNKSDVLITIEEMDFQGNIVKVENLESLILHPSQINTKNVKLLN